MSKFYYEFDEHHYYGLVVVSIEDDDFKTQPYKAAIKTYVDEVAGENVGEIMEEGLPNLRTKEYAFMKFMYACRDEKFKTLNELIQDFESLNNGAILVDSGLL